MTTLTIADLPTVEKLKSCTVTLIPLAFQSYRADLEELLCSVVFSDEGIDLVEVTLAVVITGHRYSYDIVDRLIIDCSGKPNHLTDPDLNFALYSTCSDALEETHLPEICLQLDQFILRHGEVES